MSKVKKQTSSSFKNSLNDLLSNNGIYSNEITYQNFKIRLTPSKSFPEMVTIVKTQSEFKNLKGKRYVNLDKVKIYIDSQLTKHFIDRGNQFVNNQLKSIGLRG